MKKFSINLLKVGLLLILGLCVFSVGNEVDAAEVIYARVGEEERIFSNYKGIYEIIGTDDHKDALGAKEAAPVSTYWASNISKELCGDLYITPKKTGCYTLTVSAANRIWLPSTDEHYPRILYNSRKR